MVRAARTRRERTNQLPGKPRRRNSRMHRVVRFVVAAAFLVALPLAAQQNLPDLIQAQQVLVLADSAGAQTYAKSLYDDAAYRIRFAQENISSPNGSTRQQAQMRAREALFAARAALAKARWLS